MKLKIITLIFLAGILMAGCDKACNEIINDFDGLAMERYYETEIFNPSFSWIYGSWDLYEVSGGIHGGGHELNFDVLKIKKYGIYAFIKDDLVLEYGRINVDEQTHESLSISFVPHPDSEVFMWDNEKNVVFQGLDTMLLYSPCCDRFNYHFVRK